MLQILLHSVILYVAYGAPATFLNGIAVSSGWNIVEL